MQETSIFSFSHNVLRHIQDRFNHLSPYMICRLQMIWICRLVKSKARGARDHDLFPLRTAVQICTWLTIDILLSTISFFFGESLFCLFFCEPFEFLLLLQRKNRTKSLHNFIFYVVIFRCCDCARFVIPLMAPSQLWSAHSFLCFNSLPTFSSFNDPVTRNF